MTKLDFTLRDECQQFLNLHENSLERDFDDQRINFPFRVGLRADKLQNSSAKRNSTATSTSSPDTATTQRYDSKSERITTSFGTRGKTSSEKGC